jgi:CBS-domain-containing membrane protein
MAQRNYGAIVVTREDGKLAGILTERDLMIRVVSRGVDPESTTVSEVMTTTVKTAQETDDVAHCLKQMSDGRFRHLPVVDAEGALSGMVSQGDFVAITWPQLVSRATTNTRAMFGRSYQGALLGVALLAFAAMVTVGA